MSFLTTLSSLGEKLVLSAAVRAAIPTVDSTAQVPVNAPLAPEDTIAEQAEVTTAAAAQDPIHPDPGPTPSDEDINAWACKINAAYATGVIAVIDIGTQLLEAKQSLGHGHFTTMVQSKVRFGLRQAEKYMRIADHKVLADPNYSSILPGNVSVLNMLASVKEEDLLHALEQVELTLREGQQVDLHSRDVWTTLIPALQKDAKQGDKTVAESDGNQATPDTKNPATDTSTDTTPVIARSTASAKMEDQVLAAAANREVAPGQDATADTGTDSREEPTAEAGESSHQVPDTDSHNPVNDNKVIRLTDRLATQSEPGSLTPNEKAEVDALERSWATKMAPEWHHYSKPVRIYLLTKLLREAETETEQQAA